MGLYVNINGSKKIISSVYANINGARRKLWALFANVNGLREDVLEVRYAWKRYKATSWEKVHGSWNTYTGEVSCSFDSSQTHTLTYGYVSVDTSYDSYTFSPSTGQFTGRNGATCSIHENYENDTYTIDGRDPYNRWATPYGSHQLFLIGSYHMQVFCKKWNSLGDTVMSVETMNNGFDIQSYYYAKPTAYSTSYDIVTSTNRYQYHDGEDYSHYETGEYSYSGYRYEYIGQL